MILVFGLGNFGKEYTNNRHNVGFKILENLAVKTDIDLRDDKYLSAKVGSKSDFKLIKPNSFINNSGEVVSKALTKNETPLDSVWIIHDDTEVPLGQTRIKFSGTSAGHNGIKSIDEAVGTGFWRIRVGVGRPENQNIELADYVLTDFTKEETEKLSHIIDATTNLLVQSLKDKQLEAVTINAKKD